MKTGDSVKHRAFVLGVEAMRQEAMRTLAEDCEAAAPTRVWTAAIQAAIEAIRDAKVPAAGGLHPRAERHGQGVKVSR